MLYKIPMFSLYQKRHRIWKILGNSYATVTFDCMFSCTKVAKLIDNLYAVIGLYGCVHEKVLFRMTINPSDSCPSTKRKKIRISELKKKKQYNNKLKLLPDSFL